MQVYETVEAMFVRPDDVMKAVRQPDDANATQEEPKSRFKKLSQVFGRKNKSRKSSSEENNSSEDSPNRQPFANFFDSRASMFGKKPPKPEYTQSPTKSSVPDENDWTIV